MTKASRQIKRIFLLSVRQSHILMQLLSRNTASNVQRAEYIRKMFSGKIGMGVQMFDPFITLAQHILWCKEWMRNSLFYRIMEESIR